MSRRADAADTSSTSNTALLPSARCGAGGSSLLYLIVAVASIGGLLFGYDTGVVSGAMIKLTPYFGMNTVMVEATVSSTVALAALGALCSGPANRLLGRRLVLIAAAVVFTAGAVLMALARTFAALLGGRMVVGLGVGVASATVPLYIAELAPPAQRGRLVAANNSCIVVGQVVAALVDGALSGVPEGWRWMLGLGGVPSALQLLGLLALPESPRWLVSVGREARARAVLLRLRSHVDSSSDAVEQELEEIRSALEAERRAPAEPAPRVAPSDAGATAAAADAPAPAAAPAAGKAPGGWCSRQAAEVREVVRVAGRQLRLGCFLMVLQQFIGINTIMRDSALSIGSRPKPHSSHAMPLYRYYSATILQEAHVGTDSEVIWLAAPVAAAQLVGTLIGMALIDRLGRRTLVLASLVGVALSLAAEGAAFAVEGSYCPHNATEVDDGGAAADGDGDVGGVCAASRWLSLVGMVIYLLAFGCGMSPVPWTVNAEIYPMGVRSTCLGVATAINWLSNLLVAATFLTLQEAVTKAGAFWLYAGVAVGGAGWLAYAMPETKGKTLEQIEALFN